jgi:ORF6N domain
MKTSVLEILPADIDSLIVEVRGQKVILDSDLACIYGVRTKALNQAVKRNRDKFPEDFLFRLTPQEGQEAGRPGRVPVVPEVTPNRSQIVTGSQKHRDPRYLPYAFTEHGAIMAANVLNSPRATQMSVFVVRAFVKMRSAFGDSRQLARKLALLEHELKIRLNIHEAAIVDVLQRIMRILDPPPPPPEPPPPEIGFHVKEDTVPYRVRRKAPRQ